VSSGGTYRPSYEPCIRAGSGCMSVTESIEKGFHEGSGIHMGDLRRVLLAATTATVILIVISLMSGLWRNYAAGAIEKADLIANVKKAIMIVLVVYTAISFF
jgi:hypothetical protein